jgi:hypothetical protein
LSNRRTLSPFEKEKILKKQKNKCAGYPKGSCSKDVGMYSNFDHKQALGLGGKDELSNIHALCYGCHATKTREDNYKIRLNKRMEVSAKDKKIILQKMTLTQVQQLAKKYGITLKDKIHKVSFNEGLIASMEPPKRIPPTKDQYIKALTKQKILQKDVDSILKTKKTVAKKN